MGPAARGRPTAVQLAAELAAPALLMAMGVACAAVGSGYRFVGSAPGAGPSTFPVLIGAGMAATGAGLGALALMGHRRGVRGVAAASVRNGDGAPLWGGASRSGNGDAAAEEGVAPSRWGRLLTLLTAVGLFALGLRALGAPLAGALLFAGAALAFGAGPLRAALWGALAGAAVQLLLGLALGLPVPLLPAPLR